MKHILFLVFLLPIILFAVRVDVSVNKYTISTDDQLELTLKVSDGARLNISEPSPPGIQLFTFRNLTSSSSSSMVMNGTRMSSEFSHIYRYIYFPTKTGSTTVPAFNVTVNGKAYQTRPIQLTVIKGQGRKPSQSTPPVPGYNPFSFAEPDYWTQPDTPSGDTRLLALPENQTVYRGFPAIVSYYIYTDSMVRSFNLEAEKDFSGYGKSTFEQPTMLNYENVRLGGKSYKRALIKRLAIIPGSEGVLQAPQMEGKARLYSYGYSDLNLQSTGGKLTVRALPGENIPAGFTGAVGNFELSHSLSKQELGLGEALTFTLKIRGRGNFNQFTAPLFSSGQGFQVSSPMVIDNLKAGIEGTRTYYYTLIPQTKGEFKLPELKFAWFANDAGRYQVYHSPRDEINVKSTPVLSYLNRLWEPRNPRSIYPRLLKSRYPDYRPITGQSWYWILIFTIGAGTIFASALALDKKLKSTDPEAYARKKADKILQRYMKQAFTAARELSDSFYPLAEKALFDYLAAKYKLPRHLSVPEKLSALNDLQVPKALIGELQSFLDASAAARFRPASDRAINLNEDLDKLKRIVRGFAGLNRTSGNGADHED